MASAKDLTIANASPSPVPVACPVYSCQDVKKEYHNCTRICFEVGYNNQSYFTRVFKQITGLTPRQFRAQNKRQS